jgi:hypothetical protein
MILVHIGLQLISAIFDAYRLSLEDPNERDQSSYDFAQYIQPIVPSFGAITFFLFSIWFLKAAYRLRQHLHAHLQFLQLFLLSILASTTFAITLTNLIMLNLGDQTPTHFSVYEIIFFEVARYTIFSIRGLLCLGVLGFKWPKHEDQVSHESSRLSGGNWIVRLKRFIIPGHTTFSSEQVVASKDLRHNLIDDTTTLGISTMEGTGHVFTVYDLDTVESNKL